MTALKSAVQEAIQASLRPLVVTAVIGPAGNGLPSASAPLIVRCRDHGAEEFVIKCAEWSRDNHPYLCANEWIAGLLALQCDVPALDVVVVQHTDCLAIGWRRIPQAMWATVATHPDILSRIENPRACYEVAAFDAFIRNPDRHTKNVTARRLDPTTAIYQLFVSDHDRALMPPGVTPATIAAFPGLDDPQYWIREPRLRARINNAPDLRAAVRRVQDACSAPSIMDIVNSTPDQWLSASEAQAVIDFLVDRSARLKAIVDEKARAVLPGLF